MKKTLLIPFLFFSNILYSMCSVITEKEDISDLHKKFGEQVPTLNTIFYAAEHNNFELVQYCVQNRMGDVNDLQKNDNFRTPLMMACKNLNLKLIKFLLNNGAHVHYVDSSGLNALYYILWHMEPSDNGSDSEEEEQSENDEKKEVSEKHDEKLQEINEIDCEIKKVFKKILKIFLDKGIDINYVDNDGNTLLIHAVKSSIHPDLIKILIDFGANPALKNKVLKSAADYTENKIVLGVLKACPRRLKCVIL